MLLLEVVYVIGLCFIGVGFFVLCLFFDFVELFEELECLFWWFVFIFFGFEGFDEVLL